MRITRPTTRRLVGHKQSNANALELFAPTMGVHAPLHVGHSDDDTSKAAAISVAPIVGDKRARVLAFFVERGESGATTDEAETALAMKHQTCSARVHELAAHGFVEDSGDRRLTSSGRTARVYRVTDKGQIEHLAANTRRNTANTPTGE